MKLAMTPDYGLDEAEAQTPAASHGQRHYFAPARREWVRKLFTELRRAVFFLAGVGIIVFLLVNRTKIDAFAQRHWVGSVAHFKSKTASNSLRQNALKYEQTVDEIAAQ